LDVVNLAAVWGLGQERGMEAVGSEARSVVMQAQMKKSSFKGVVDIIYGGEKTQRVTDEAPLGEKGRDSKVKRKADVLDDEGTEGAGKPISKRQLKRQAKEARSANANAK
jgi:ribonuclease P/MRP protein subunit RPP1